MWTKMNDDNACGCRIRVKNEYKKLYQFLLLQNQFTNKNTNLGKRTFAKMVVSCYNILIDH